MPMWTVTASVYPAMDSLSCVQPVGYVLDNTDGCPAVTGTVGSPCDDVNASTVGDMLDAYCMCVGQD